MKLELYHKELLANDGSKFREVKSKNNCYNVGQALTPEQIKQAVRN